MAAWRYEISLLVLKKYLRSLVKYFSTIEEKFRILAWPCNILYLSFICVLLLKVATLAYPHLIMISNHQMVMAVSPLYTCIIIN